jgi:putative Mg2+ transporter-C (MgtC) family protein
MDDVHARLVATLAAEFSDLADVEQATRVLARLLMAVLLCGLIGWERERGDKTAGLRTHILVGLGAAIVVLAPAMSGAGHDSLSRVVQGIVAGVGFLGAGAILKHDNLGQVRGLTTAASIWAAAAIGITVGMGLHATAIAAAVMVMAVLRGLMPVERYINARRRSLRQRRPQPPAEDRRS